MFWMQKKKSYKKDFNKNLIKRFAKTYPFWNGDINNFILFLRKEVYPYEYMDSWKIFEDIWEIFAWEKSFLQ